jgi:hypothetical protein
MTTTNENYISKEIKSKLNMGNASYYAVKNILSSHPLSKNVSLKMYKN